MRLICLECSAAYEAPDSLFGPQPREVRCNRCGYQWTVVGAAPDNAATPGRLSIGPVEPPAPSQPAEPARPRPEVVAPMRPEPVAAPLPPPPAPPVQRAARLAETLARPVAPRDNPTAPELPRPILVVEPAAESPRTLLSSAPAAEAPASAPPDPEERRLSHELDFGGSDRQRRPGNGGTRRAVVFLILLIILAGLCAVVFKPQIIAAVPALAPIYAQVGL